ncbi:sodium:proton antiporter [Alsobacter soli]|uniref:Sodium:proton antiporter n=1 Tax=Alsobacter soli TaxID=2109933 RepID=A0A2T1HNH8_9HYPH|nr:sodium:proton antiporter [Alsobacter soli]PSC03198.1 sodium:proton antiporter [Alsobacter soli]
MSALQLAAVLLFLTALFGWVNVKLLRIPNAIGMVSLALATSLALVVVQRLFPDVRLATPLADTLKQIDFPDVVLNGMLCFLLFAGAFDMDWDRLRDRAWPVATLAVVATVITTAVVGVVFWAAARWLGNPIGLSWCLVFGALISPTDPVAVLSMVKSAPIPERVQTELQGESLFNDGVGVVLFTLLVGVATSKTEPTAATVALELVREAGGGAILGLSFGYVAYRAMKAVDDFPVEVMITLALVTVTYSLAQSVGASGPLAVVVAGILIGERGPRYAMSDKTKAYVSGLWTLIDEVLNAMLFLLLGLQVIAVPFQGWSLTLALLSPFIVLAGRLVAVAAPLLAIPWSRRLSLRNVPLLTWAGVRGGICVALALALPGAPEKTPILAATYAVVIFSILVQGSTLGWVARRTGASGRLEGSGS